MKFADLLYRVNPVVLIGSLLLAGCAQVSSIQPSDVAGRQIQAIATTGMVADVVKNVGGERVQVTALMGPGVDPHLYKPSERNVIQIAGADIIFYSGLHLEAQMAEVFERMGGRIRSVAITEAIDPAVLLAPPEFEGAYDPHVWFDVRLWLATVSVVQQALSELDPSHAAWYAANATAYQTQLEELDAYVRAQAERIPAEQRVLVTAHDAFNYFGRAYGFEVRGLQGISTSAEAGTGDVQDLAEFIAIRQLPAIFVESSVSPRTIQAVQAAVQARGFSVAIGGQLFSDAMGDTDTPEGTYIGMVRHNIDTITQALLNKN